jgi:excisionase family DNA binding protein
VRTDGGAAWPAHTIGFMADNTPSRRFLTIEQVAEELNVGEPLVRAMLKTGQLRGIQVGGRGAWRIGANDIEDFIDEAYRNTAERVAAGDLKDTDQGSDE